ncbi:hypothetical protein BDK92_6781 [Micromonospora pisi]|uniref:Uncharacterized protein n=1 Tax=Micromonospora pisi TaxID=589240 RepID=A0A495JTN1_9ACTN|nr:hypothetical protein BDK92_6781 [Micromonospora pisi]
MNRNKWARPWTQQESLMNRNKWARPWTQQESQ